MVPKHANVKIAKQYISYTKNIPFINYIKYTKRDLGVVKQLSEIFCPVDYPKSIIIALQS